jgi:hypothetical protein
MNQHCGKHDKIFTDSTPCPGCALESVKVPPVTPKDLLTGERGPEVQGAFTKFLSSLGEHARKFFDGEEKE